LTFNSSVSGLLTLKVNDWFQIGFWLLLIVVVFCVLVSRLKLCLLTMLKTQ
jgi:hypothetical protein